MKLNLMIFIPCSGDEIKTPSPVPIPIIAPPTVIEPSPMDDLVSGMTAAKISPPKKVIEA